MTPEEAKRIFAPRLAEKYLIEPDKITIVNVWQAATQDQKDKIQRLFEEAKPQRAGDLIQAGRKVIALTLAETRVDEITADGNISLASDIDELR
jgi:hypothetical protein